MEGLLWAEERVAELIPTLQHREAQHLPYPVHRGKNLARERAAQLEPLKATRSAGHPENKNSKPSSQKLQPISKLKKGPALRERDETLSTETRPRD